jgi:hypothetical protein
MLTTASRRLALGQRWRSVASRPTPTASRSACLLPTRGHASSSSSSSWPSCCAASNATSALTGARVAVPGSSSAHHRFGCSARFLSAGRAVFDESGPNNPPVPKQRSTFFDTVDDQGGSDGDQSGGGGVGAFPAPNPSTSATKKARTQETVMEKLDRQR